MRLKIDQPPEHLANLAVAKRFAVGILFGIEKAQGR
jgi:hypothetical protein